MNMKRNAAVLSVLLALCLIFSNLSPALALTVQDFNGDRIVNYVALGSSAAAGHGLADTSVAYPSLIAQALNVQAQNLALEGMRMEELRVLLDDAYAGDDYTAKNFADLTAQRGTYRNAIKNADLITIDLSQDGFGMFVTEQLDSNGTAYTADVNTILNPDQIQTIQMGKAVLGAMLAEEWGITDDTAVQLLVDTLLYSVVGFTSSFDAVVSAIHALNPNAKIVVLAAGYGLSGVTLSVDGKEVSLDGVLSAVTDYVNLHAAVESEYAGAYFYAYAGEAGVEMVSEGIFAHPSAAGHLQLKETVLAAIEEEINGAVYYDPLTAQMVYHLTGIAAKTPSEAMKGEYVGGKNSHYVAIGDVSASVEGGYATKLAALLGIAHTNLSASGLYAADCLSILESNADLMASADLFTLGFTLNTTTDNIFTDLKNLMKETGTPAEHDWSQYLSDAGIASMEKMLSAMHDQFIAEGFSGEFQGQSYADMIMVAVEYYLYDVVAHVSNYTMLVENIHSVNPSATVVLVGMFNPMKDLELEYYDSIVPLGKYLQMVTDLVNAHYMLYAMTHENVIFVEASEVQTVREADSESNSIQLLPFLTRIFFGGGIGEYMATDNGHAYIAAQVKDALTVKLLGDVNGDGKVNNIDAMLVLQCAVGVINSSTINTELADVNGDTRINNIDAMLILQYAVGVIQKFPVEN